MEVVRGRLTQELNYTAWSQHTLRTAYFYMDLHRCHCYMRVDERWALYGKIEVCGGLWFMAFHEL